MIHLKPCPFCGGKPEFKTDADGGDWLRCSQCFVGINALWYDGDLGVVEGSWNRRADDSLIDELVKALQWAKPYVARLRDTEIIDSAIASTKDRRIALRKSSEAG